MAWKKHKNQLSKLSLLPLILAVAVTPLLMRLKVVEYPLISVPWRTDQSTYPNFFTYYKGQMIIFAAILAIAMGIYYYAQNKIKINKNVYNILIGISIGFIILATLLAKYPHWALYGQMNRVEGVFVLVSYFVLLLYGSLIIKEKAQLKTLFHAFFASAVVMNIIGIMQFLGHDPYRMDFMKKLILPSSYWGKDLTFRFSEDRVYMTLFNPNYVGSYAAIVITYSLNMLLNVKDLKWKLLWTGLMGLSFINLAGSQSMAGIVGTTVGIVFLFIINYQLLLRNKKKSIAILLILIIGSASFLTFYKDGRLMNEVKGLFNLKEQKQTVNITRLITDDNKLYVTYKGTDFYLTYNQDNPEKGMHGKIENEQDIEFQFNPEGQFYDFKSEALEDLQLRYVNIQDLEDIGMQLTFDDEEWLFTFGKDGINYMNKIGRQVKLQPVDYIDVTGYEKVGSGRAFIWSRTLPLFKETFLIGYGPDGYIFEFPQTDYLGKSRTNMINTVVDKPHNMYLQYGVNIGVLPLLIFLGLIVLILVKLFKVSLLANDYFGYASGLFASIIAYLATGMFNDSSVTVAPLFYVFLGLSIAVIYLNQEQLTTNTTE